MTVLSEHAARRRSGRAQHVASPRFQLRAATADAHARLDTLYAGLDLSRVDHYAHFLAAQAAAFLPVEDALFMAGADALIPGWAARRRGGALLADLAGLGLETPPSRSSPRFESEPAVLGGLYVLEGSRLGGAVLARAVAPGLSKAFLTPEPSSTWLDTTALLDARLSAPAAMDKAAAAATAVFALFERCARETLEPTIRAE